MRKTIFSILLGISLLGSSGCDNASNSSDDDAAIQKQVRVANNYLEEGEPTQALEVLETLLQNNPNNIKVLEAMAYTYSDMGDPGLAAFYFEQIVKQNPQLYEFRIFAAQAYCDNEDWGEAARNYRGYLDGFPSDSRTWKLLGDCFKKAKDFDAAISAYEQAFDHSQNLDEKAQGTLLVQLGDLHMKAKEVDQAKVYYYKALKILPRNAKALSTLLKIEVHTGNFALAEKLLHTFENSGFSEIDAHFIKSAKDKILAWRQDQDAAQEAKRIQEEQKLAQAQEEAELFDNEALHSLALTEESSPTLPTEDTQTLPENTQSVAQTTPTKTQPTTTQFLEKAQQLRDQGQYEQAVDLCWKAITTNSKQLASWSELAHNYYLLKNYDDAEMSALEALRLDPSHLNSKLNYLNIVKGKYSPTRYMRELEEARSQFKEAPEFTLMLADHNYENEGNRRQARLLYEEFLVLAPHHKEANRVKQLLSYL